MDRRGVLKTLAVWAGAVAGMLTTAEPAKAYYYFYQYRYRYYVNRRYRRHRWHVRVNVR